MSVTAYKDTMYLHVFFVLDISYEIFESFPFKHAVCCTSYSEVP